MAQGLGVELARTPPQPFGPAERTVVMGLDGVMYPTYTGNQEARVAVVYEPDGAPVEVVSDGQAPGALWAGIDLEPLQPARIEILDFYHVTGRLAEIAVAMHGGAGAAATAWSTERKQELLDSGPRKPLEALCDWKPQDQTAGEVRLQLAYFERQEERLHSPDFLRRGHPIWSGAVGDACKHVIADRFDESGMRWKPGTADPLMRVRAALLTQPRWDLRSYAAAGATRRREAVPAV